MKFYWKVEWETYRAGYRLSFGAVFHCRWKNPFYWNYNRWPGLGTRYNLK